MNKEVIRVAIDGPVGAGKTSISKECAKRLGYIYFDTGALYRAVGFYCLKNGIQTSEPDAVKSAIQDNVKIEIKLIDNEQRVILNGLDISDKIRTPEISMLASKVSAQPFVREFLLDFQKDFAKDNSVIMDGRDIGTVILPDAEVKIFLTASPEIRAGRRYDELVSKGILVIFDDVLADLNQRDFNDSHREAAPLCKAIDALLVDTDNLSFEQSVEKILNIVEARKFNGGDKKCMDSSV